MGSIGVVITTFNSSATLRQCLASVSFCDQILVVDSGSGDGTVKIARSFGAEVYVRPYVNAADQKNWALKHLQTKWVLVLDADEHLSPKAARAVYRISRTAPVCAYRIRRISWFLRRYVRFAWLHDWPLRLFPSGSGCWEERLVHADFRTDIPVRRLSAPIIHHIADTLDEYIPRWLRHTRMAALELARRKRGSLLQGSLSAIWRFMRQYVLQMGFLEGRAGFSVAVLSAASAFIRHMLASDIMEANRVERRDLCDRI